MRYFTRDGTHQIQNGSSNLLTPYRKQLQSTQIVVAYPRPALSAKKRTNHASFSLGHPTPNRSFSRPRRAEVRKIVVPRSMAIEAVWAGEAGAQAIIQSSKPNASLKNAPPILPIRRSLLNLVGRKQTVVRDKFSPQKSPVSHL